ncbi:MAG: hypothetical protein RRY79_05045 [Clostridia bacterium]
MKRKFFLVCGGDRINLSDTHGAFLVNPSGLGFAANLAFGNLGNGFFCTTESGPAQPGITGDLNFANQPYVSYRAFVKAVMPYRDSLILVYKPRLEEYRIDVELEYIQKGEVRRGMLTCPISFRAKTPWYSDKTEVFRVIQPETVNSAKINPYKYSYRYPVLQREKNVIRAGGHIPAALEITVKGASYAPKLELKTLNGATLGKMTLGGLALAKDETLVMSSRYGGEHGVWVGGVNACSYIDLNDNNFFRLPPNQSCILDISDATHKTLDAVVRVYAYYLGV